MNLSDTSIRWIKSEPASSRTPINEGLTNVAGGLAGAFAEQFNALNTRQFFAASGRAMPASSFEQDANPGPADTLTPTPALEAKASAWSGQKAITTGEPQTAQPVTEAPTPASPFEAKMTNHASNSNSVSLSSHSSIGDSVLRQNSTLSGLENNRITEQANSDSSPISQYSGNWAITGQVRTTDSRIAIEKGQYTKTNIKPSTQILSHEGLNAPTSAGAITALNGPEDIPTRSGINSATIRGENTPTNTAQPTALDITDRIVTPDSLDHSSLSGTAAPTKQVTIFRTEAGPKPISVTAPWAQVASVSNAEIATHRTATSMGIPTVTTPPSPSGKPIATPVSEETTAVQSMNLKNAAEAGLSDEAPKAIATGSPRNSVTQSDSTTGFEPAVRSDVSEPPPIAAQDSVSSSPKANGTQLGAPISKHNTVKLSAQQSITMQSSIAGKTASNTEPTATVPPKTKTFTTPTTPDSLNTTFSAMASTKNWASSNNPITQQATSTASDTGSTKIAGTATATSAESSATSPITNLAEKTSPTLIPTADRTSTPAALAPISESTAPTAAIATQTASLGTRKDLPIDVTKPEATPRNPVSGKANQSDILPERTATTNKTIPVAQISNATINLIVAQWTKARLNPESHDVPTGLPEITAVNTPQDRATTEPLVIRAPRTDTDTSALSQKFAEQLGQRLTRELSNTPWRAELELHPKSLGRIDIQLDFVNGQLEGHFQSGNALTRELMQDSLPRLRELLQNGGHTSVQLDVGSGGANSSGERGSAQSSGDGQAPKIRITQGEEFHHNSPMKSQTEEGFDLFV